MLQRLRGLSDGIPVVATGAAAVEALRGLGARTIALFDPPWFDSDLNALGRRYYEAAGFEVVFSSPCDLPSGQALIRPGDLHGWIQERVPERADAVVLGGNGLRAVGVIERLEADTGKPVVTPNQVLVWAALRAAGTPPSLVSGYGKLFSIETISDTAGAVVAIS
jgi:maleate isomerase